MIYRISGLEFVGILTDYRKMEILKKDLMNSMDSMYGDMLKEVSIPDFTKCIAQFAGMKVQDIKDEVIRDYLVTWAENKYQFYKLLGNKLKLDMPITYENYKLNVGTDIELLKNEFPGFAIKLKDLKILVIMEEDGLEIYSLPLQLKETQLQVSLKEN